MATTKLGIINKALIEFGCDTITAEELTNPTQREVAMAVNHYQDAIDWASGEDTWSFLNSTDSFTSSDDLGAMAGYPHSFTLPTGISMYVDCVDDETGRKVNYRVMGEYLLADSDAFTLFSHKSEEIEPDSDYIPDNFWHLVSLLLAYLCVTSINGEKSTLAAMITSKYNSLLATMKLNDQQRRQREEMNFGL